MANLDTNLVFPLLVGLLLAAITGAVGSFIWCLREVMHRMYDNSDAFRKYLTEENARNRTDRQEQQAALDAHTAESKHIAYVLETMTANMQGLADEIRRKS